MGIDKIKGVGPATLKKLDAAGVRTLDDVRSMDTDVVAKRTGIQKRRLDEWRMEARMMKVLDDVKGIGPATKKRLKQAGIHSLEDLARASVQQVAHQARVANDRAAKWKSQAQTLLKKTHGRIAQEGEALKERGRSVGKRTASAAKRARKEASRAVKQGSALAGSARDAAQEATRRGHQAVSDLVDKHHDPGKEQSVEEAPAQVPHTQGEGFERPGDHVPGTNGHNGGFLGKIRRLFQPRTQ